MYEVDFLPVEGEAGPGSKSGDAITIHFEHRGERRVVVIDAGYSAVGEDIWRHVKKYYNRTHIDLVISTHPDADHINGISTLLDVASIGELMIHQPRLHIPSVADFSNIETVDEVIRKARRKAIPVTEPFTGLTRFDGALRIMGPTEDYYVEMIRQHVAEERTGAKSANYFQRSVKQFTRGARDLLARTLSGYPAETLTDPDDDDVSARNNSSVITLLEINDRRLLLTGDAGVPALEQAADHYEATVGAFSNKRLRFFQAPHHGSRRNLGPTILNRLFGRPGTTSNSTFTSFISSAKLDEKHPSPKIVNAIGRRGGAVSASESQIIRHHHEAGSRDGWTTLTPIPPLDEGDDD